MSGETWLLSHSQGVYGQDDLSARARRTWPGAMRPGSRSPFLGPYFQYRNRARLYFQYTFQYPLDE